MNSVVDTILIMTTLEILCDTLEVARENYRQSAENCLEARGNLEDDPYCPKLLKIFEVAEAEHDVLIADYDAAFDAYSNHSESD